MPAGLQARFVYDFNYEHTKAEHDFFLLEQLDGYDDVYQNIIGSLPSERELLSVIDPGNSLSAPLQILRKLCWFINI